MPLVFVVVVDAMVKGPHLTDRAEELAVVGEISLALFPERAAPITGDNEHFAAQPVADILPRFADDDHERVAGAMAVVVPASREPLPEVLGFRWRLGRLGNRGTLRGAHTAHASGAHAVGSPPSLSRCTVSVSIG